MIWIDQQMQAALHEELPASISKRDLKRMNWGASRRLLRDARFWIVAVAYALTGGVIAIITTMLPLDWFGSYRAIGKTLLHSLMLLPVIVMYMALIRPKHQFHVRAIARERGHELCPQCGYFLAPLSDAVQRCPECGAEREPMPSKIEA